jgi:hypothetical protein
MTQTTDIISARSKSGLTLDKTYRVWIEPAYAEYGDSRKGWWIKVSHTPECRIVAMSNIKRLSDATTLIRNLRKHGVRDGHWDGNCQCPQVSEVVNG